MHLDISLCVSIYNIACMFHVPSQIFSSFLRLLLVLFFRFTICNQFIVASHTRFLTRFPMSRLFNVFPYSLFLSILVCDIHLIVLPFECYSSVYLAMPHPLLIFSSSAMGNISLFIFNLFGVWLLLSFSVLLKFPSFGKASQFYFGYYSFSVSVSYSYVPHYCFHFFFVVPL